MRGPAEAGPRWQLVLARLEGVDCPPNRSAFMKHVLAMLAAACVIAIVIGDSVKAQNPPARGMRWSKAAPFPEPEEELYGTVLNGKFYVIGGFGFTPPGVQPPPPGVSKGPCFSCPPALVYEYDPGPDKWTKKKNIRSEERRVGNECRAGRL